MFSDSTETLMLVFSWTLFKLMFFTSSDSVILIVYVGICNSITLSIFFLLLVRDSVIFILVYFQTKPDYNVVVRLLT